LHASLVLNGRVVLFEQGLDTLLTGQHERFPGVASQVSTHLRQREADSLQVQGAFADSRT